MAEIPEYDNLHYKLNMLETVNEPRTYSGLSGIGGKCYRKLQYYHYWAYNTPVSARMQRLFNFGHMMENYIIADLAKVGIFVTPDKTELIGETGHWRGHTDGDASSEEHPKFMVEFKTHNDRLFKKLKKEKVREGFPGHYDQMTAYMGYKEVNLTLYVGYNKNDSEYHCEWVNFDPERFHELKRKQIEVIASDVLFPRIGNNNSTWFECKLCDARHVCFGRKKPEVNCRTCQHVDILDEGLWKCGHEHMHDDYLSIGDQRKGCDKYQKGVIFND